MVKNIKDKNLWKVLIEGSGERSWKIKSHIINFYTGNYVTSTKRLQEIDKQTLI